MKFKISKYISILSLLFFVSINSKAQEIRTGIKASYEFVKNTEAEISYQKRFLHEDNIRSLSDIMKLELSYSLFKRLKVGISYRSKIFEHDDEENTGFDINDNQRLTADVNYNPKIFEDIKLKNRFRYQNSMFDNEDEEEYLRMRMILEKKVTDFVVPYLGYELFIEAEEGGVSSSRFYLGNGTSISEKISLEVYIINEKKKLKKRTDYMIGVGVKYKI